MLQAKSEKGIVTTLVSHSRKEILDLKKNKQFYCPTCNEPVIIKAGSQVMPHFAHRSKVNCPSNEGGEGAYHEKGKLLLFKWLKQQGYRVILEAYLSKINQRPDILLDLNGKLFAIEFQCARIPIEQIQKRNDGYRRLGITPLWILGANNFKRIGKNLLQINQFTLQFLHQFNKHQRTLFYFDSNTSLFTIVQDLYEPRKGKALVKFRFNKLSDLRFNDIFQYNKFSKTELLTLWKQEKYHFRLRRKKRVYGRESDWHQWLYVKQIPIDYLPSFIYLPVPSEFVMKSSPWDWQSRIVLDLIDPLPIGAHFTIGTCTYMLRSHYHPQTSFPLLRTTGSPIKQYLQFLCYLHIIQQVSNNSYKKLIDIPFYDHLEDAIKGDEQLLDCFV